MPRFPHTEAAIRHVALAEVRKFLCPNQGSCVSVHRPRSPIRNASAFLFPCDTLPLTQTVTYRSREYVIHEHTGQARPCASIRTYKSFFRTPHPKTDEQVSLPTRRDCISCRQGIARLCLRSTVEGTKFFAAMGRAGNWPFFSRGRHQAGRCNSRRSAMPTQKRVSGIPFFRYAHALVGVRSMGEQWR